MMKDLKSVVASSLTGGYLIFVFLSMRRDVAKQLESFLPKRVFQAIVEFGKRCEKSPSISNFRSLSSSLALLWWESVRVSNVSIVDIFWGLSFVISGWTYSTHSKAKNRFQSRKALIFSLVTAWGSRLSTYLLWRNHLSTSNKMGGTSSNSLEDYRYQKFRKYYNRLGLNYWWFSLFQVFALQGALSHVVSSTLRVGLTESQPKYFTFMDLIGVLTWTVGYCFEHIGDLDLVAFRSNPSKRGSVLQDGLWAHTRHPNYFGNSMMWWGIYFLCCNARGGWKTIYSPVLMTYLLTNVSGSKLLERTLKRTKPGFAEYVRSVPEFVPWKLIRRSILF
jgi:steroid 5-alpha reductase family enzyme